MHTHMILDEPPAAQGFVPSFYEAYQPIEPATCSADLETARGNLPQAQKVGCCNVRTASSRQTLGAAMQGSVEPRVSPDLYGTMGTTTSVGLSYEALLRVGERCLVLRVEVEVRCWCPRPMERGEEGRAKTTDGNAGTPSFSNARA
jgi:hypothetical protein